MLELKPSSLAKDCGTIPSYIMIVFFAYDVIWACLLCRTPHVVEQVNIGSGPPGSKVRWFRSTSNEPRFINTVTFENPDAPTIVLLHGYGASQGFFFRNFDALASKFRVLALDQIGWVGVVSRTCFVLFIEIYHLMFCSNQFHMIRFVASPFVSDIMVLLQLGCFQPSGFYL